MNPSEALEVIRREVLHESCGDHALREALFVLSLPKPEVEP